MAEKSTIKVDPEAAQQVATARIMRAKKSRAFDAATKAAELAADHTVLKLIVKPKRSFKWKSAHKGPDGKPLFVRYSPGNKFECTGAEFRANKVIRENTVPDLDAVEAEAVQAAQNAIDRAHRGPVPAEGEGEGEGEGA